MTRTVNGTGHRTDGHAPPLAPQSAPRRDARRHLRRGDRTNPRTDLQRDVFNTGPRSSRLRSTLASSSWSRRRFPLNSSGGTGWRASGPGSSAASLLLRAWRARRPSMAWPSRRRDSWFAVLMCMLLTSTTRCRVYGSIQTRRLWARTRRKAPPRSARACPAAAARTATRPARTATLLMFRRSAPSH